MNPSACPIMKVTPSVVWASRERRREPGWRRFAQGTETTALEGLVAHPVVAAPLRRLMEAGAASP